MRYRTEDLLALRDDEPIDAMRCERLRQDPAVHQELATLTERRHALAALPTLRPDPQLDQQVLAAMRIAAQGQARQRGRRRRYAAAALLTPVLVATAVWLAHPPTPAPAGPPLATPVAQEAPPAPHLARYEEPEFDALRTRSAQLERLLVSLPAPRAVISADTAGTIVDLENRIAMIDSSLNQAAVRGALPRDQAAFWRERVELMNALVQVRYAQSRVFPY
ncbi:MAG: hypothetical protein IT494_04885 [Gammaproteobacteria bacterium]|nr:hypothetical protein [Gammaproteobacteria bacterium]